jgi:hypothetical protein
MQGREYRIHGSGLTGRFHHHCSSFFPLTYKCYRPAVHNNNNNNNNNNVLTGHQSEVLASMYMLQFVFWNHS